MHSGFIVLSHVSSSVYNKCRLEVETMLCEQKKYDTLNMNSDKYKQLPDTSNRKRISNQAITSLNQTDERFFSKNTFNLADVD